MKSYVKKLTANPYISTLFRLVCAALFFSHVLSHAETEEQNATKIAQQKANSALEQTNGFKPEDYSKGPATDLKKSLDEYQQKKEKQTQKIRIDLKQAIEETDKNSLAESVFDKNLANAFSIADIRTKALKNNLSIEVARIDPAIAGATLRQEQAKFDNIIFAYARQTNRDTPQVSGDNVSFTSKDSINGQEAKLTTLEQNIRSVDIAAGVRVPLRTGGSVTLSSPLESKKNGSPVANIKFSLLDPFLNCAYKGILLVQEKIALRYSLLIK